MIRSRRFSDEKGIDHGFSTRIGGISAPPFDTLNLGTSRNEPISNILNNYRILCSAYGLDYDDLALVRHEHGSKILRLTGEDRGRGLDREPLEYSDGLVTNDPSVTLVTCHADCSAFFFYDSKHKAIGLAHAGWKGMFARIGQRTVERMQKEFGSDPSELIAAAGPCICEKCFEVDLELGKAFEKEFDCPDILTYGTGSKSDKAYVSLHAAAVIQLLDAGLDENNISLMNHCTMEEKDLFYSYRRDGKDTGSMAAYLKLK
ncbi:MAG: peptidoglycan editing factor PgeF [Clostridiales bacterium]|nr:peptidoglycan editing factor PgeF [Clostridiales bacterium]